MCNHKVLVHTKDGYVIQCNQCSNYQLSFGTTASTFNLANFNLFCDEVIALYETKSDNGLSNQKNISIDLFCKSVMMIVSYNELVMLYSMICEAKFNMEIDDLLTELNFITE